MARPDRACIGIVGGGEVQRTAHPSCIEQSYFTVPITASRVMAFSIWLIHASSIKLVKIGTVDFRSVYNRCLSGRTYLILADSIGQFDNPETTFDHIQNTQIGDNAIHNALTG